MKRIIRESEYIFGMANVVGNRVKVPGKLPFSFYFSACDDNPHGIRVKVVFNPERMRIKLAGYLTLHGEWEYVPGDQHVDAKDINRMRKFFKQHKVLFAAVWEDVLPEQYVQDYFHGKIGISELVRELDMYDNFSGVLEPVDSLESFEAVVRENQIFNMND